MAGKATVAGETPSISAVGDRCCGCGACAAACPVSCLAMEPDGCGFLHPAYEAGCVGCGRCARVCPVLAVGESDEIASIEWAKAKDDGLRNRSSKMSLMPAARCTAPPSLATAWPSGTFASMMTRVWTPSCAPSTCRARLGQRCTRQWRATCVRAGACSFRASHASAQRCATTSS